MLIQLLLIAAILALAILLLRRPGSDSHLALRRLVFGLFALAAILSVLFPQWLTWVARLVGVGRGTDLLLYGLVVIFLVFVYTQYRRNTALQRQVTILARKIALLETETADAAKADDAARADDSGQPRPPR
jgi:hypothetical protein